MFEPMILDEELRPGPGHWIKTGYEGEVYLMNGGEIALVLDGCTPPSRIKQMVRVWTGRNVQPD